MMAQSVEKPHALRLRVECRGEALALLDPLKNSNDSGGADVGTPKVRRKVHDGAPVAIAGVWQPLQIGRSCVRFRKNEES